MTTTSTVEAPTKAPSIEELRERDKNRPRLVEIVKGFEDRIRGAEQELETNRHIPLTLAEDLYDAGMFRAFLPYELGGLECDPIEYLEAVEEVSSYNGSVGWLCMLHAGGAFIPEKPALEMMGDKRFLTAGVLGRAAGKARKVPGGYIISGRWSFASGSPEANFLYGMSILYDENGEMVRSPIDGNPWYVTGYFPREQVTLHDTWDGLGLRGTGSGDFEVSELFVPREHVNERGIWHYPYKRPVHIYRFSLMAHAAHAIGLARAAMDEYRKIVHQTVRHGSLRQARLGKEQADQLAMGQADALVRAARLLVWEATREAYEDAHHNAPISYENRVRLHQANTWATHAAKRAVNMLFERAGSATVFRGKPLERIYRDMTVAGQHLLITEVSMDRIGQYELTKDLPTGPEIDTSGTAHIAGPHPQFAHKKLPKIEDF